MDRIIYIKIFRKILIKLLKFWNLKHIPTFFLLIYAFFLGFFIDLFSGSLGFHSTATVLLAFVKPAISRISIPHNILGDYDKISMTKIGSKSFITYAFLLIIIHNTVLFSLEHLSFSFSIFAKIVSSSILTLVLILIMELFKNKKK